ncbi:hypothetical protein MHBO_003399 [Bonamia ostreae]|uniref:Uncharacterized protein n=1 Tax=Bonamia ostreae TaxID=126728 RepID=A0ABV2AQP1_9EUKA
MAKELKKRKIMNIKTLYDFSNSEHCKSTAIETFKLLRKIAGENEKVAAMFEVKKDKNILTSKSSILNEYYFRKNRPFLIISSTSWTPDEDFSILLNCIKILDKMCQKKYIFVISGFLINKSQF